MNAVIFLPETMKSLIEIVCITLTVVGMTTYNLLAINILNSKLSNSNLRRICYHDLFLAIHAKP